FHFQIKNMRKLKLEVQISIDGYIAETDGKTDWMVWNWGPVWKWDGELQKYHTDLTKSVDCVLLSRQMAEEGFIDHWARAAQNPKDPQSTFAKHITDTRKIVFTKTLDKTKPIPGGWDNTDIAKSDLAREIHKLKQQKGKDIIVYGGATFVSSLIKAELIDEFHLLVNPVAVGSGLTIFNTLDRKQNMVLVKSKSFACGIVLLHYKPKDK
ncbi:MAG: deaminase, partial [Segetibacter sp.]|nr:deaminase [Segetibacter sp.]